MNKIPRNILELYNANTSKNLESFNEKICINTKIEMTKIRNVSMENKFNIDINTKYQNEKPIVTINDFTLEELVFISDKLM